LVLAVAVIAASGLSLASDHEADIGDPSMMDPDRDSTGNDDGNKKDVSEFERFLIRLDPGAETYDGFNGKFVDRLPTIPFTRTDGGEAGERGLLLARLEHTPMASPLVPIRLLEDYVEGVARRLLEASPRKGLSIRVRIAAHDRYNAVVYPDGAVFLSLGAINNIKSEDELAMLLAHELSHVLLGHAEGDWFFKAQEQGIVALNTAVAAKNALARRMGRTAGGAQEDKRLLAAQIAYKLGDKVLRPSLQRKEEDEADLLGVDLLFAAGYQDEGRAAFFRALIANAKDREAQSKTLFAKQSAIIDAQMRDTLRREGIRGAFKQMFSAGKTVLTFSANRIVNQFSVEHREAKSRRKTVLGYTEREYDDLDPGEVATDPWKTATEKGSTGLLLDIYRRAFNVERALNRGDLFEANRLIGPVLAETPPGHSFPWRLAADVAERSGNWARAVGYLEVALATEAPTISAFTQLARINRSIRKFKGAARMLDRAKVEFGDPKMLIPYRISLARAQGDSSAVKRLALVCAAAALKVLGKSCSRAAKGEFDRSPPRPGVAIAVGPDPVRVGVNRLNARVDPSATAAVIAKFKSGRILMTTGRKKSGWIQVHARAGKKAWVFGKLVAPLASFRRANIRVTPQRPVRPARAVPTARKVRNASDNVITKLRALKSMRAEGLITEEEYAAKRRELLKRM